VRYYYRPKGQKGIPMPDLPANHPDFLAAYAKLAGRKPQTPVIVKGTIAAVVSAYLASNDFKVLAEGTRAVRRRAMDDIAARYGHAKAKGLKDSHLKTDLNRFEGHARNNRLKAWRGLSKFMISQGIVERDPSEGIAKAAVAASDGHEPWSDADVSAFRAKWALGTVERLAMELLNWTGARISDAIGLGPQHVDRDGWLAYRQGKTGSEVFVPFARALPDFADNFADDLEHLHAAIRSRNTQHLTWLHTKKGAGRSVKAAPQWFSQKAEAAGLTDKTAHGLRKRRAEKLMEEGATEAQGMAWLGHADSKMLAHYAKKHNRKRALSRTGEERKVPTASAQSSNFTKKDQ
jgi:site-specific recombinase XerD